MANSDHIEKLKQTCKDLAEIREGDTHKLAATLWEQGMNYMSDVRQRARRSFFAASIISVVGTGFFFTALYFMMKGTLEFPKLTLIAGTSIQLVSGIGFYLYAKTTKEFFAFHLCLERLNRYLLANTICEKLSESLKHEMRKELIHIIASAPPLSVSLVERGESDTDRMETETVTGTGQPASSFAREFVTANN